MLTSDELFEIPRYPHQTMSNNGLSFLALALALASASA